MHSWMVKRGGAMRGVFITGSDKGVGKTVIGAALARRLSLEGLAVRPRKPVESGCAAEQDGVHPGDRGTYYAAIGAGRRLRVSGLTGFASRSRPSARRPWRGGLCAWMT